MLPYKEEEENYKRGKKENKESEFVPIKINYDNDDVYRRFNNLVPLYTPRRRYFRRYNNNDQFFSILGVNKKK